MIDPLFFSQACSDAQICLRTGPFCGCGIDKMREELEAARPIVQMAISIAHGFDETCGKFPELERLIAVYEKITGAGA